MKKLKIFLTGSSGFIGRNIIEKLNTNYEFIAPSHKDLDLNNSKAVDAFFNKNGYFDFVIHTAIVGGNRKAPNTPYIAIENLRLFFNLTKNQSCFRKMIYVGSGIEYGKERSLKLVEEDFFDKYIPQDNFGFYKYLCAKYIENVHKIVNMRVFGIFGKYEDSSIRFISNAICKNILGMPITINQNVYFDYIFIDDFVKILDYFLNNKVKFKSYNVGSGTRISLISIAKKINRLSGNNVKILVKHQGFANEYTSNNKRLVSEVKNIQFTKIDESISNLYRWYYENKDNLRRKDFVNDYFN